MTPPTVSYWLDKPVTELSREELLEVIEYISKEVTSIMPNAVQFEYLNHRGTWSKRTMIPDAIEFLYEPVYDYQPGWFLSGWDTDKKARRSFALSRIKTSPKIFRLELGS